jgi:HTH-type transcriptional regulator/antitoxin HigA
MEGAAMMIRTKLLAKRSLPAQFASLVALMPPRVIRDETDYDRAIAFMDCLLARPKLSNGQREFFETWSLLIADYEQKHHAIQTSDIGGLDILRHLLSENEMTASDLGELLGNRSLGSKILRGERELSKAHLRILAERFRVSPGLFI